MRAKVLLIGPTPPPPHGNARFTEMLLGSPLLRERFDVAHLDTSDRRTLENLGRFDVRNAWLAVRHVLALTARLARTRPDIVYLPVSQNAWAYLRDGLFITAAKAFGARVVTHLHGGYFGDFYRSANPLVRVLIRRTSRWVDTAIVLGPGLRAVYSGLIPPERVHVVPNGVPDPWAGDRAEPAGGMSPGGRLAESELAEEELAEGKLAEDEPAPGELPEAEGGPAGRGEVARATPTASRTGRPEGEEQAPDRGGPLTVSYMGGLGKARGTPELVDAAAILRGEGLPLRVVLAGSWLSPSDREELPARIARQRLEGTVELRGVVASAGDRQFRHDTDERRQFWHDRGEWRHLWHDAGGWRQFWRGTDIFVFPSRQAEGQPLAILEAMAAGVPVIATARGAIPDMVVDGVTGLVVAEGDAVALAAGLAAAIRRLAADAGERRRMGRLARERYLERFTEERCLERLAGVFREVAGAGGAGESSERPLPQEAGGRAKGVRAGREPGGSV